VPSMLVLRLIKTLISNYNLMTELSLIYLSRLVSTSFAGQYGCGTSTRLVLAIGAGMQLDALM
jgi:hypothetical protein